MSAEPADVWANAMRRARDASDVFEAGHELLDDVAQYVRRHVVLSDEALWTVTTWIAHAHTIDAFYTTPRLNITSPEAECGKTMLMVDVMGPLLPDPIIGVSISPAALYRVLQDRTPPILIDELDNTLGKKGAGDSETLSLLLAILNSGYRRGQYAWRCIGTKQVHRFPTFAPAAFAGIAAQLKQPFITRSIEIPLQRRRAEEHVIELEWSEATTRTTAALNTRIAAPADAHLDAVRRTDPDRPDGMRGRLAECWVPLLKIASVAGGEWPDRIRVAFDTLAVGDRAEDASTEHRLLVDLHEVFGDDDELHTSTILARLNTLEDSPWGSWNDDKGIKAHELAKHTKRYRTHAKTTQLWIDGQNKQGYKRAWFEDAWARYLSLGPCSDPESPRTPRTVTAQGIPGVAEVLEPTLLDGLQPLRHNSSRGLGVSDPDKGPRASEPRRTRPRHRLHREPGIARGGSRSGRSGAPAHHRTPVLREVRRARHARRRTLVCTDHLDDALFTDDDDEPEPDESVEWDPTRHPAPDHDDEDLDAWCSDDIEGGP